MNSTPSHDHVEPLEPRQLLSASLHHGTLTVNGTRRADIITVRLKVGLPQIVVRLNGTTKLFDSAGVRRVRVNGRGGGDSIFLGFDENNPDPLAQSSLVPTEATLNVPASVSGGNGDDQIIGGDANDFLKGGSGDDSIVGNAGNDRLDGGIGSDTMFGGAGNDQLAGGRGNDVLSGGDGNDGLFGNAGRDVLNGNAGTDRVTGGSGVDTFSQDDSPSEWLDRHRNEPATPPSNLG